MNSYRRMKIGFLWQCTAEIQEENRNMGLHARNWNPAKKQKQKKKLVFNRHKLFKLFPENRMKEIENCQKKHTHTQTSPLGLLGYRCQPTAPEPRCVLQSVSDDTPAAGTPVQHHPPIYLHTHTQTPKYMLKKKKSWHGCTRRYHYSQNIPLFALTHICWS